jgi:hypothetical protein
MVIKRNVKIIGKLNQLLVKLWAGFDVFDEMQNVLGTKFDFRHVECKPVSFPEILDYIGWKHWKKYGKNWDVSKFMEVVWCYEQQRKHRERNFKKSIEGD